MTLIHAKDLRPGDVFTPRRWNDARRALCLSIRPDEVHPYLLQVGLLLTNGRLMFTIMEANRLVEVDCRVE